MEIKVLGPGCPKCKKAEALVREAVAEAGSDAQVEKVSDILEIAKYGPLATPAVIVDGQVKISGKVPRKKDVLSWLK
ncbi:MAG: TM0996/MTH895 family glutaredoxin-like protein [Proteobacteria bacterium]|nr:TM0996/MTH895 family glutaredoxin-like protein [Pseudomonadota bacterium]